MHSYVWLSAKSFVCAYSCAYLHSNAYVGVGVLVLEFMCEKQKLKAKLLKHKRPMNVVQSLISKQTKLIEFKIEIAGPQR